MLFPQKILHQAKDIKLLALDVDGVFTDANQYLNSKGDEEKFFNTQDGFGIELLLKNGIEVAIISGGQSTTVTRRFKALGIKYIYQGKEKKLPLFHRLLGLTGFTAEQTAYVGDDILDIPILRVVKLPITVANAHFYVRPIAHWQTKSRGGFGAVREVCDLLLEAQGGCASAYEKYLTFRDEPNS